MQHRSGFRNLIFSLIPLIFFACATPPLRQMTVEERVRAEQAVGGELAHQFEQRLKFKQDVEISVYLRKLAEALIESSPELKLSPIGIFMIDEVEQRWRNFSIRGNRVYLSVNLLKKLNFETQVAGAIAFELSHILNRSVMDRMSQNLHADWAVTGGKGAGFSEPEQVRAVEYFGVRGVFTFSEEMHLRAVEAAVGILYQTGYDPRGLISLWEVYKSNPAKTPIELKTLDRLIEKTRRVIAQRAPLRNPVVRTNAFLEMQKRIKKL